MSRRLWSDLLLCLIDRKSLTDLGILPNGAGDWPLGVLLDHTHSARARQALLDIIAQPLASKSDIETRQRLFRALPQLTRNLDWVGIGGVLLELESYLESNFIIHPASMIDATLFALRYPDATKFIARGQKTFAEFLKVSVSLRQQLVGMQFDSRFQLLVNAFDAVLDTTIVDEVRRAASSAHQRRNAVCGLDRRVRVEMRDRLLALIAAFHQFDGYCSLAHAARKTGLVMPQIVDRPNGPFAMAGLHHPLLPAGIPNNIVPGADRVLFLTGPNMAGKSTLLRSLGIAIAFAHLGLPVPATSAAIPLTDRLVASLGNEDSLIRGESLYLAEVRRVKSVVADCLSFLRTSSKLPTNTEVRQASASGVSRC